MHMLGGMPCTQCARSAHAVRMQCEVLNVGQYSNPTFGPFDQFLVPYWGFFGLLCSWDVAHLNCHPLLPNVNHFYPFSIPHIELSPLWGPREGRGDVAIHSTRTLREFQHKIFNTKFFNTKFFHHRISTQNFFNTKFSTQYFSTQIF